VLYSKSSSLVGSSWLFPFPKIKYKEVKKYNSRVVFHSSFERIKYMQMHYDKTDLCFARQIPAGSAYTDLKGWEE